MTPQTTTEIIYENWRDYNAKLRAAIVPLKDEHLTLRPAEHLRTLGQTLQHIIDTRAWWINGFLKENEESINQYMEWGVRDAPARTHAEILQGIDTTWAFMEARLQRWTPEDCEVTFPHSWRGNDYQLPRSWVIYHVLEHDLHHGGEVSLILGMHQLQAPDV